MHENIDVNVSGPVQPTSQYKTVVLKGQAPFAAQVTEPNTKYVIKHNFDLGGESVTIPEGCLFEFDGGAISNGTLVGQSTILIYNQPLNDILTATLEGTWRHKSGVKADEEDITNLNGELKFKDKAYAPADYSGLGRKILRKNLVNGVNTLTQEMMSAQNTKYVIKYDYILGEDITVPANCILEFDGGSLSGYKVVGNYTRITGIKTTSNDTLFDDTFITDDNNYYASVFGILTTSEAIGERLASLTKAVSRSGGGNIIFGAGIYYMGVHLENGALAGGVRMYPNVHYIGAGISKAYDNNDILSQGTVIRPNKTGEAFHSYFSAVDNMVENVSFENIEFNTYLGTGETDGSYVTVQAEDKRRAVSMHYSNNVTFRNCKFVGDFSSIETRDSHPIEQINAGDYGNKKLTIENCEFCAKPLSIAGYIDITFCGITASECTIRNNIFYIDGTPVQGGYYQNCAVEFKGANIDISNNVFKGFTNAMDWAHYGAYNKDAAIDIHDNKIYTTRGIGIWGKQIVVNGINIYNNYFKPATDFNYRVDNSSNCITIIKHARDSYEAIFTNINIHDNIFDYDDAYAYYLSLDKGTWNSNHQNIITNSGYCFEDYYATISMAPYGQVKKVTIANNVIRNSKLCAIFTGGNNYVEGVDIINNTFIDCGTDDFYILFLSNKVQSCSINSNIFVDSSTAETDLKCILNDWIGQAVDIPGYPSSAGDIRAFTIFILKNIIIRLETTDKRRFLITGGYLLNNNGIRDLISKTNNSYLDFVPDKPGLLGISRSAVYVSDDIASADNWIPILRKLVGSQRPTLENVDAEIGVVYFDTSLSPARPIWWTGTDWVDATGTPV